MSATDRMTPPASAEREEPRVKPLTWEEITQARSNEDPSREVTGWEADAGFSLFYTVELTGGGASMTDPDYDETHYDDPDAAKAAAQADYEHRIRSALLPSSIPAPADGALVAFAKEVIRSAWDGGEGGDVIQEAAVKHGLLKEVAFDPAVHNDPLGYAEEGNTWYVFAGPLAAAPAPSQPVADAVVEVEAVCSARPRPSVQKGAKGHQWWKRDVWHISAPGKRTLCGIDASEWLIIGKIELNDNCCSRCRAALPSPAAQPEAMANCPICAKPLKESDTCATDIELGTCHAECLEGSPTVDLETGEPVDGPIPTFPYSGALSGEGK